MSKKRKRKTNPIGKILIILFVFLLIYIAGIIYFNNHFAFRTTINDINVSLMNKYDAEDALKKGNYNIEVIQKDKEGNTLDEKISINEICDRLEFDVSDLLKEQNNILWFTSLLRDNIKQCNDVIGVYDKGKIDTIVNKLYCMQENNIIPCQDASISLDNDGLRINEANDGLEINRNIVLDKLNDTIGSLLKGSKNNVVDLRNDYNKANIQSASLIEKYNTMQKVLDKKINISIDNSRQTFLERNGIINLLNIKDNKFEVNVDNLKFYVENLRVQYPSGDDSIYMDTTNLSKELSDDLLSDKDCLIKVNWIKDKSNTYIEVSINKQTLYFYQDGELVLTSPVVTGGIGNETPTGTFEIQRKVADTTLKGADYVEHVDYWIGWDYGTGGRLYGFHDASWRDDFGGEIYLSDGSHGCVNMPVEKVGYLFNHADYGTEVRIHQ